MWRHVTKRDLRCITGQEPLLVHPGDSRLWSTPGTLQPPADCIETLGRFQCEYRMVVRETPELLWSAWLVLLKAAQYQVWTNELTNLPLTSSFKTSVIDVTLKRQKIITRNYVSGAPYTDSRCNHGAGFSCADVPQRPLSEHLDCKYQLIHGVTTQSATEFSLSFNLIIVMMMLTDNCEM
jgi:hypothetical protein